MIKLSLNLFVLQTGAAKARVDLGVILLGTHWQKVTEFMVPLRINVHEEFLT